MLCSILIFVLYIIVENITLYFFGVQGSLIIFIIKFEEAVMNSKNGWLLIPPNCAMKKAISVHVVLYGTVWRNPKFFICQPYHRCPDPFIVILLTSAEENCLVLANSLQMCGQILLQHYSIFLPCNCWKCFSADKSTEKYDMSKNYTQ